jgi:hypothetical protein
MDRDFLIVPTCPSWVAVSGRSSQGFVVPPDGGFLEMDLLPLDRREFWEGRTNYPAPYWNRWTLRRMHGRTIEGPFHLWWYGEWV